MAFTDYYVSVAGGGAHDGTSEANAWTLAESLAAPAPAGARVNVKTGSYTLVGGTSAFPTGTIPLPILFRGYNSTIGDLDTQGWNADGTLNYTNFPVITVTTAVQVPGVLCFLQNLRIEGALSSYLIGSTVVDDWGVISCSVQNTQNNAAAGCIQGDDNLKMLNSDFYCSGAAHAGVVDADTQTYSNGCRYRSTSSSACLQLNSGTVINPVTYGNGSSVGIKFVVSIGSTSTAFVHGQTCYAIGTAVEFSNNAFTAAQAVITSGMATDNADFIESLYSATADNPVLVIYNRTRDNTTAFTGIAAIEVGTVTTDTGGASTDYTDAANGNFYLIAASPGAAASLRAYANMGALQTEPVVNSGSTGFMMV